MYKGEKNMGKIVVMGAAILDVLVHPAPPEVFLTGSSPVSTIRISTGGDALNEAVRLAQLGIHPQLCTLLGKDDAGELIKARCQKLGIGLELAEETGEIPTSVNVVLVQENGERNFLTNPAATLRQLKMVHLPAKLPKDTQILCFASMFVSPWLKNQELSEIFSRAKKQGVTVCADMTKCKNRERAQDMRETLANVDYLFANEEEAACLTGKGSYEEAAEELLNCGAGCVILKLGRRGCYAAAQKECFHVPAFRVPCVDTTGAGDSFAAGFLYGLMKGESLRRCAIMGNACGALAVKQIGTEPDTPLREELDRLLAAVPDTKEEGKGKQNNGEKAI